jgi:uncharacterized repeat protein (TIGR01451 family)
MARAGIGHRVLRRAPHQHRIDKTEGIRTMPARIRPLLDCPRTIFAALMTIAALCVPLVHAAGAEAYSSKLMRYPYLTDVVGNSATINWATDRSSTTSSVKWGTVAAGNCTVSSKAAAKTSITVGSRDEYQWKATLTLTPDTEYCYRIYFGSPAQDLLGSDPSPRFHTQLPSGSGKPYTFAVFGNWGEVDSTGANPQQANLMQQIAASGARFAVTTGDNAYNSGNQTNYGDLAQVGSETSAVFGPSFWTVPGASVPIFPALGNHGISTATTHFLNWPQTKAISTSGGRYTSETYCCLNGTSSRKYGSAWYAFDAGNARFYVLQAAWADTNVGTATVHKNDYDYHWAPGTPEREWLENDLATHPSQLKFAFFQYPLYADNNNRSSDKALQGRDSLEGLLSRNGVDIAFSGDAHLYQRNLKAHADSLVSYTTGGGGSKLAPIGGQVGCSAVDAYGVGWSHSANGGAGKGSRCGAAPVPASKDEVFHFLKVSVDGTHVTVTPINSLGQPFDPMAYEFGGVADLSVTTADAPDPAQAWQTLTYTSTVTNHGASAATGVVFEDQLPAGTSFESASPSQGSCSHSAGTVRCSLGGLASGASATVGINVVPQTEGTMTSVASAYANEHDPATADNSASTATEVNPASAHTLHFAPTDDAYVNIATPATNYGGAASMIVDADPEKDLMLKFNVSGLAGSEVVSASLQLYCIGSAVVTGGEFHGAVSNSWQEGTVTWNTAPAANPITLSSLGRISAGNWYEIDVTPLVTGDGTYTIRASSTSGDGADYATKEGAAGFAPRLLITTR